MNIKEKVFSENIVFRLKPEEKEKIKNFLCKKKKDKLGEKLREFILQAIDEKNPVIEYSINRSGEVMELILFYNDKVQEPLYYENIDEAMKYVRSIDAIKRKD